MQRGNLPAIPAVAAAGVSKLDAHGGAVKAHLVLDKGGCVVKEGKPEHR